jgi:hypothetical protein
MADGGRVGDARALSRSESASETDVTLARRVVPG